MQPTLAMSRLNALTTRRTLHGHHTEHQVLQLAIATVDNRIEPNGNNLWDSLVTGVTATAISGFALALCMMFSFRQMVDAQLNSYKRTNKGVKSQAEDEDELVQMLHKDKDASGKKWSFVAMVARNKLAEKAAKNNQKLMPLEAAQRILLVSKMFNVLGVFVWQTKAMCVMLVGVGVKLSMYDPLADPNSFFGLQQVLPTLRVTVHSLLVIDPPPPPPPVAQHSSVLPRSCTAPRSTPSQKKNRLFLLIQRLELALALSLTFFIEFFHSVYIKNRHAYMPISNVLRQPKHLLVIFLRLVLFGTSVRYSSVPDPQGNV